MRLHTQFPEQDFSEVEIPGKGKLKVRFRYPSYAQIQAHAVGDYALAICKYCIAEIEGFEDREGNPLEFKASESRAGEQLSDTQVSHLFHNDLHNHLATYYQLHASVTEEDKKK